MGSKSALKRGHFLFEKKGIKVGHLGEERNESMDETQKFQFRGDDTEVSARDVLLFVYDALKDKGYNPTHQIVGYLISGDPAYIPRYNNARTIIRKVERDELIEELVIAYLEPNS